MAGLAPIPLVSVDWLEDDLKLVHCSECGEISCSGNRTLMARAAYRHAEEVHDGLVERDGWV